MEDPIKEYNSHISELIAKAQERINAAGRGIHMPIGESVYVQRGEIDDLTDYDDPEPEIERHPVHLHLSADEYQQLTEFYQNKIDHHKSYIRKQRARPNERSIQNDNVIRRHQEAIDKLQPILDQIAEQCW